MIANNMQAHFKQYGLKHHITGIIHSKMGDTLIKIETEMSTSDLPFRIWDKGKLVVVISRRKIRENCFFK